MSTIDDVLERLVGDADFRAALARDPGAALAEYDLGRAEVELLASRLDSGDDGERTVEQRTSKSAMLSFLSSLGGAGGGTSASRPDSFFDIDVSTGDAKAQPDSFFDIDVSTDTTASGEKAGTEDMNIGIGELQESEAGPPQRRGKVEASWKIEEGVGKAADPIDDYMDDHPPSGAAADTYLKVGDIQGESGRAAPGTELDDIGAPQQEQASMSGYLKIADIEGESEQAGAVFPKVEIDVTASESGEQEALSGYMKIQDIAGESTTSGGDVPTENVALNFTKIQASTEPTPDASAVEDFLQIDDA